MDNIVARIEKLKPHPTEAIVLGFNFNDTDVHTMNEVFNYVKSKFPNNADEELLKKIYGEIARYWCKQNICKDKYIKYINL